MRAEGFRATKPNRCHVEPLAAGDARKLLVRSDYRQTASIRGLGRLWRCSQRQRTLPAMQETLGSAIHRLRLEAGYTLRGFAEMIGISAAHQSDVEHGRRLPSEQVLRATTKALSAKLGGTTAKSLYETLRALDARFEDDLQQWAQQTPIVRQLLREVKDSGRSPRDVLRELKRVLRDEPVDPRKSSDTRKPRGEP